MAQPSSVQTLVSGTTPFIRFNDSNVLDNAHGNQWSLGLQEEIISGVTNGHFAICNNYILDNPVNVLELDANSNALFANNVNVGGTLNVADNAFIAGNLAVADNAFIAGNLAVGGTITGNIEVILVNPIINGTSGAENLTSVNTQYTTFESLDLNLAAQNGRSLSSIAVSGATCILQLVSTTDIAGNDTTLWGSTGDIVNLNLQINVSGFNNIVVPATIIDISSFSIPNIPGTGNGSISFTTSPAFAFIVQSKSNNLGHGILLRAGDGTTTSNQDLTFTYGTTNIIGIRDEWQSNIDISALVVHTEYIYTGTTLEVAAGLGLTLASLGDNTSITAHLNSVNISGATLNLSALSNVPNGPTNNILISNSLTTFNNEGASANFTVLDNLGNNVLFVNGDGSTNDFVGIGTTTNIGNGPSGVINILQVEGNSYFQGNIYNAGNILITGTITNVSDKLYKKNIEQINSNEALELVNKLNPVRYDWKTEEYPSMNFSNNRDMGFIAQELKVSFPELVRHKNHEDGTHSVDYAKLVPILAAAIQKLSSELNELKSKIE
jgi:hypothetical protein